MINDKKIEGHGDFIKRNNAIINIDLEAYEQAKKRASKDKILESLIEQTNKLEESVNDINCKLTLILKALSGVNINNG